MHGDLGGRHVLQTNELDAVVYIHNDKLYHDYTEQTRMKSNKDVDANVSKNDIAFEVLRQN